MTARGVCDCPKCGYRFEDDEKVELEIVAASHSSRHTGLALKPATEKDFDAWGDWVLDLVRDFGAQHETAAQVSALFVKAIRDTDTRRRSP